MNVVIVGCGNVGFETAKLLSDSHSVLLINRRCPEYLTDFLQQNGNVSFALADATHLSSIESILARNNGFSKVDVLVSTVGALCPTSAIDGFDQFKRNFSVNFFGNLVPIKAVLKRMIAAQSGRIIVISSTSGVFTYQGLTAYAPAKWAVSSFCRVLRSEVTPYGISVDVLFPRSIKNKRSQTFLHEHGIEPVTVASKIVDILQKKCNKDHFIPRRYALLHPLERVFPCVLDRRANLRSKRRRRFRSHQVKSVLIIGASSALGKELARLYSKTAERLYLIGPDEVALFEIKKWITQASNCEVDIASLDMGDSRAVTHLAGRIESIDLLINSSGCSVEGWIRDIPIAAYERCVSTNLFGVVQLTVEFLHKRRRPCKIINILSTSAVAGRPGYSCCSASKAALWAFTRSLRRTFGNEIQVMEVISAAFQSDSCGHAVRIQIDSDSEHGCSYGQFNRVPTVRSLTAKTMAWQIFEAETEGKEVVMIPLRSRLFVYLEAVFPRSFARPFDDNQTQDAWRCPG